MADAYARLVQNNKARLTAELRQSCQIQDRKIRDAWKTILDSVRVAQDAQSDTISAYENGLSENTFGTVTADLLLPEVTLPSYREIAAYFTNSSTRSLLAGTTPAVPPTLPSPQASPTQPRPLHHGQGNAPTVPDRACREPVEQSRSMTTNNENVPAPNNEQRPPKRVCSMRI